MARSSEPPAWNFMLRGIWFDRCWLSRPGSPHRLASRVRRLNRLLCSMLRPEVSDQESLSGMLAASRIRRTLGPPAA